MNFTEMMDIAYNMFDMCLEEGSNPPEGFGKSNLNLWNRVQYEVWKDFISEYGYDRNDAELFGKFGAFFFAYWGEHHLVPHTEEFASYLGR